MAGLFLSFGFCLVLAPNSVFVFVCVADQTLLFYVLLENLF